MRPLPLSALTFKIRFIDTCQNICCRGFLNGTNANLEMVKAGLSEVYRGKQPRYFNVKIYQDAEKEAQKAKRNMWALGDKYISPREWRRGRRN
jgi:endonuclease YncB( thermonuclease family)